MIFEKQVSVGVLERNPIFLAGLRIVFARQKDILLCRSLSTSNDAVRTVSFEKHDVLLVSERLAVIDAVQLASRCQSISPTTKVIYMTESSELASAFERSRSINSVFIVSRCIDPDNLIALLRQCAKGQSNSDLPPEENGPKMQLEAPPRRQFSQAALTRRECEIARLVAQGMSNRNIADLTHIQPGTVNVHVYHIFRKLGIHSRFELLRLFGYPLD